MRLWIILQDVWPLRRRRDQRVNFTINADGYDINIEVTKADDDNEVEKPRFRTGFCLPEKTK
jgi:hypothetical protein